MGIMNLSMFDKLEISDKFAVVPDDGTYSKRREKNVTIGLPDRLGFFNPSRN